MRVVCTEAVKYYNFGADVNMQYNTLGRERKGSVSSIHNVSNWFSSLRRTPKKNRSGQKVELSSKSAWDLSTLSKNAPSKRSVGLMTVEVVIRVKDCSFSLRGLITLNAVNICHMGTYIVGRFLAERIRIWYTCKLELKQL